jgi:hypothetical protein
MHNFSNYILDGKMYLLMHSSVDSGSEGTGDNIREAYFHLCDRIYLPRLTPV